MANNTTPRGALTRTAAISGVGLAGTDYVRQGVVDQSGYFAGQAAAQGEANKQLDLRLIGSGVEAGLNAAHQIGRGVVLHGIERDTQDLIDNYTTSINAPIEALAQENTATSLWANLGDKDKPSNIADINTVEQKHAETLGKLQKAFKQGAITSLSELEARVLQVTREAVNRTPGLAQEIMGHSQRTLHLSGVRGMVNPFEQQNKDQAKEEARVLKVLEDYHKQYGLHYDPLNRNPAVESQKMQEHLIAREKNAELEQSMKLGDYIEKSQVKGFIANDLGDVNKAHYLDANQAAQESFQPGVPYEQSVANFRSKILQLKGSLEDKYRTNNVLTTADGKKIFDNNIKNLDELVSLVSSFESGEDALKAIQNQTNIMSNFQKGEAMKMVNLDLIKAMGAISPLAASMALKADPAAMQALMNGMVHKALTPGMWGSSSMKDGVNDVTAITGGLINSNQPEGVTKAFDAIASFVNRGDPMDRVEKLTDHFRELSKSEYRNKLKDPDPAFESTFRKAAEQYLGDVGRMFNSSVREANTTLGMDNADLRFGLPPVENLVGIGAGQEAKARAHILRSGLIEIESSDSDLQAQLTDAVANRYNDVIKTYANIMNVPYKEASDVVMSRFGNMLNIPEEELPSMPKKKGVDVNAKDMIRQEEGFRNSAYLDSAGVPTIGYGFTQIDGKPVKIGDLMTREEGEQELQKQLPKYQTFKNKVKVKLSEDQEAALTSFEYNLGSGIWDKGAKGILYAVNSGDFEYAKSLMLQYNKARDPSSGQLKILPGLAKRREREGTLLAGA